MKDIKSWHVGPIQKRKKNDWKKNRKRRKNEKKNASM